MMGDEILAGNLWEKIKNLNPRDFCDNFPYPVLVKPHEERGANRLPHVNFNSPVFPVYKSEEKPQSNVISLGTIGCDLTIIDERVADRHALIIANYEENIFFIEDCGSGLHTYLDGKRLDVAVRYKIVSGSVLEFSKSNFFFFWDSLDLYFKLEWRLT